jgi:hypothetical protein
VSDRGSRLANQRKKQALVKAASTRVNEPVAARRLPVKRHMRSSQRNPTLNERRVASVAWHGRRVISMQRFGGSAAGSQALLLGEAERTIWSSQAELKTRSTAGGIAYGVVEEEGCDASPAWIGNSGVKWGRAAGLIR